MLYAIFCYHHESETTAWSKEKDAAVMAQLAVVQNKLRQEHRLGPVARLMPTTTATTVRKDRDAPLVLDGPFAETKEQLLGFYLVECETHAQAVEVAQDLARANPGGAHELRPVAVFFPNEVPAAR